MDILNSNLSAEIPPAYAAWIDQVLQGPIPQETVANCTACVMCPPEGKNSQQERYYFNPEVKCCTYIPELPNFLCGSIIDDLEADMAAGRETVQQRIASGIAVTPLGLYAPANFSLVYRNSPEAFGQATSLRCPHYVVDGGRCAIWRRRPPPCFTWYCKHNRGALGRAFWRELYVFLLSVQHSLSLWCVQNLDIGVEALDEILNLPQGANTEPGINNKTLDGLVHKGTSHTVWGKWHGRETQFYQNCADMVKELKWNDILTISGPEVTLRSQLLRSAYQELLSKEIPDNIQMDDFQVAQANEHYVKIITYSPYDPLEIPRHILEAISYFDGRPLAEVLDTVTRDKGLPMSTQLLLKLMDFGVLKKT